MTITGGAQVVGGGSGTGGSATGPAQFASLTVFFPVGGATYTVGTNTYMGINAGFAEFTVPPSTSFGGGTGGANAVWTIFQNS